MDDASLGAAAFLGGLQEAMAQLATVHRHYSQRGARPKRPHLTLSRRPFVLHEGGAPREFHGSVAVGILLLGADELEYELVVDVLWDERCWTVTTEAWVEDPAGGQTLLRELPERTAGSLPQCLSHLRAAVEDLISFEDLLPTT